MDGATLSDLIDELNGGASIGTTLKFQLVNSFKAVLEQERPWMILRRTDTSKTVTAGNTWQTAIDLSTISNLDRFYGEKPIKLFDGSESIAYYSQVPKNKRLEFRNSSSSFVYDDATKSLYLGGTPSFAGTLWIDHLVTTSDLDINSASTDWPFPSWSHHVLAFGAVAMHKGGVDYDEVNARQLLHNNSDAMRILAALSRWDANKQIDERQDLDLSSGAGDRAIDIA